MAWSLPTSVLVSNPNTTSSDVVVLPETLVAIASSDTSFHDVFLSLGPPQRPLSAHPTAPITIRGRSHADGTILLSPTASVIITCQSMGLLGVEYVFPSKESGQSTTAEGVAPVSIDIPARAPPPYEPIPQHPQQQPSLVESRPMFGNLGLSRVGVLIYLTSLVHCAGFAFGFYRFDTIRSKCESQFGNVGCYDSSFCRWSGFAPQGECVVVSPAQVVVSFASIAFVVILSSWCYTFYGMMVDRKLGNGWFNSSRPTWRKRESWGLVALCVGAFEYILILAIPDNGLNDRMDIAIIALILCGISMILHIARNLRIS